MPTSITRDNLICLETATEAAFSKGTMFVMVKDDVVEIPIPESIKKKGIIPKGYALGERSCLCLFTSTMIAVLDHACDPSTVISALAESNKATIESVTTSIPCRFLYKIVTLNLMF